MHRKRNLTVASLVLGGFFSAHAMVVQSISWQPMSSAIYDPPVSSEEALPNFEAIDDIKARKQSFLGFLTPLVEAENQRLSILRENIEHLDGDALIQMAELYDVDTESPNVKNNLLAKVDVIPPSLVLAQAAIESAWGTSRFAQSGNNLFGQWCFTKGCGLVPLSRPANATHEVRTFANPELSIRSYMHNLNTHRAYSTLRKQRAEQRARNQPLSGCYLATGLESYSQKGLSYVDMVKSLIRSNKLESNAKACAARAIAKPETPTPITSTPKPDDAA